MTYPLPLVATAIWLLAFVSSFTWLEAFEVEFVIFSLSGLFIACALSDGAGIAKREWPVPQLSPVLVCGASVWLAALVSLATSQIPYVSWLYFFFFSALPLTITFFLVGHGIDERLRFAYAGMRFVLAGLALYALGQYFFLPKFLTPFGRVFEPLADPNSLAAIFSLGIFLTAGRVLKRTPILPWLDYALLLLLVAGLYATGSRGAVLALVIMAFALILLLGPRLISRRIWVIGIAIALITILGVGLMAPTGQMGLLALLINPAAIVPAWQGAMADRMIIWAPTLQIIRDHFWLGTGIGTFQFFYPEVRVQADNTYGYMAHNEPLQFAAEMGIAAALLFYATVIAAIARTWAALKLVPRGDDHRLKILAPFAGLGALVIHSHFTYNFHVLPTLFLAGFTFALWYRHTMCARQEEFRVITAGRRLHKDLLEAAFLIVAFIAVVAVAAPFYSQKLITTSEQDLLNGRFEKFATKINLADRLSLGTNAEAYHQAARIPLGVLEQNKKPLSATEREQFKADAARLLAAGQRMNPRDPDLLIQLADLAVLENRPDAAEAFLRTALRLDPLHLSARMALGAHLDQHGKQDEAVEIMSAGLNLKYGPARAVQYMDYFLQTMALQEAQGRRTGKPVQATP